jgi:radical SAM superfamily enzyme YgiQ (UPF0313 family)
VTDHPEITALCESILALGGSPSPASMRADTLTDELLALLARGGTRSVTLAPEAGTEALRATAGKRVGDDAIVAAAARAKCAGISRVKLYFMVGMPEETDADVQAIAPLVARVAHEAGVRVSVGVSVFVPKPGTPWERAPALAEREARRRLRVVRGALRRTVEMTSESPRWSWWQAALSRGGREMAVGLERLAERGDTATDWDEAFADVRPAAERAVAGFAPDEPLPWGHIHRGTA